jgi:periplasmic glucans biosynthesis protein
MENNFPEHFPARAVYSQMRAQTGKKIVEMNRRTILRGAMLGSAISTLPMLVSRWGEASAQGGETASPFEPFMVRDKARMLAGKPHVPPNRTVPDGFGDIGYDQYRNIRFEREKAEFRDGKSGFQAQWLPRGFLFKDEVLINIVRDGKSHRLTPDNSVFRFENGVVTPKPGQRLGYSGFRLTAPLNKPDVQDEIAVFQGASYFRAIGRGNIYGSSARGLALNTADARGEEFPVFREFWIERPADESQAMVVHALLDSPSVSGACRITIRPGTTTATTMELALYPRVVLEQVGIGALTSMFLFAPNDPLLSGSRDFRPAVHDAQGLEYSSDTGERFWRPLNNPKRLEVSVFSDSNVRGFGLMQRQRSFFDYQDLEAQYEKRPSVWVEPLGDWGEGAIHLVEIPVQEEVHDNIVALWRPRTALAKGGEYLFSYRLHWGMDGPLGSPLGKVAATRTGSLPDGQLFVLDFTGGGIGDVPLDQLTPVVSHGGGKISNVVVQPNPHIHGVRLTFNLVPDGATTVELRARLLRAEAPATETWLYRWSA